MTNEEMFIYLIVLFLIYQTVIIINIRKIAKNSKVIPGAESFFYKRSKQKGALLLHGFSGSTRDLVYLGNYLSKRNITVYAPLLKGHGTCIEDMSLTTYKDWLADAENALLELKKYCKKVYIAGISVQGNTSAILAAKHKVDGIIFLGTPIFFKKDILVKIGSLLLPVVKRVKPFFRKWYHDDLSDKLMKNRITYRKISVKCFEEVLKLIRKSKKVLHKINCPALIMQTKTDGLIRDDTPKYIYNHISSKIKKIVWLSPAYHIFVVDRRKEISFKEIYLFIKQN